MFLLGTEKEAVKRSLPLNRQPAGVEILTFRRREREGGHRGSRAHPERVGMMAGQLFWLRYRREGGKEGGPESATS